MSNIQQDSSSPWWQPAVLKMGEQCQMRIGDLLLTISRHQNEWHCAYEYCENDSDAICTIDSTCHLEAPVNLHRLASCDNSGQYRIQPMVSDKPFVIRPNSPIHLNANESCVLYMSSTIWVTIYLGESLQKWISLPAQQTSLTWVGENTMVGELCYSSKTAGRMNLDLLPKRDFRIITPVKIVNKGTDMLLIDKLNLPLPHLSVLSDGAGNFCTESLTITRNGNLQGAKLEIEKHKDNNSALSLISAPRQVQHNNQFIKTVHQLFG